MRQDDDRSHGVTERAEIERRSLCRVFLPAAPLLAGLWISMILGSAVAGDTSSQSRTTGRLDGGDSRRGEELYRASCVVCHGSRAEGGVGPRLSGNPVLANEPAFRKIVHEGRHVMPPLKDALSDRQMTDILAWLKTLP